MKDSVFMVGAAREDITPVIGTMVYGYLPNIASTSIRDPLQATAMAFHQGEETVMLFSVTVASFQNELSDELRKKIGETVNIPSEHVILAATHTHSGPNLAGVEGWGELDRVYVDTILLPALCKVAENAMNAMQPAEIAVSTVCSEVGINRRQQLRDGRIVLGQNPRGCFDPEMTCIAIRNSENKKGIVNLIHYGCHGTAAGIQTEISRDWSGHMVDRLETISGTMTAYLNGAEGDVGPRLTNGTTTGDFQHVEEIGGIAASDAVRAYRSLGVYKCGQLAIHKGIVCIPRKPLPDLEKVKSKLEEYSNPEELTNVRRMEYLYYASVVAEYENGCPEYDTCMAYPQIIFSIGDIAFVPFPFEVFSEITMRLQEFSPIRYTLSLTNTNGYNSYLPTEDQLVRGGYEITSFQYNSAHPLVDNADQIIIDENLKILQMDMQ